MVRVKTGMVEVCRGGRFGILYSMGLVFFNLPVILMEDSWNHVRVNWIWRPGEKPEKKHGTRDA